MLIFVTPASFRVRRRGTVTSSGWSSAPIPWVTVKCSPTAPMISAIRTAARAGVPPPKYRLVTSFFPFDRAPTMWISRIRASTYRPHRSAS